MKRRLIKLLQLLELSVISPFLESSGLPELGLKREFENDFDFLSPNRLWF